MARWTLRFLQHIVTSTTLRVIVNTTREDHLYLSWAYIRPDVTPIYRTVRGKMIFCGNRYVWDTPITVEQIEEGDTWTHTFYLTGFTVNADVWYYLHAPCPPSEWECQGPLTLVHLLHAAAPGSYLYFASKILGMFMTTTFSGPDGPDPVWIPDNEGLLDFHISQAVLDPFIPQHRRYVIAGPHLYQMHNDADHGPANATTILTWPEAIALTGSPDGDILWVHPNRRHPGMLHVLWNSQIGSNGFWQLRTLDYGDHWTAHPIYDHFLNYDAGNIVAGFDKGTSPHPEGAVVYAPINFGLSSKPHLARSLDQGATWEVLDTPDIARGEYRPRIWVDPSNQAVVYLGSHPAFRKIYRSLDHGDSWSRVDQGENMTFSLMANAYHNVLRTHYANPHLVRLIMRFLVFRSDDYCASWVGTETPPQPLPTGNFTNDNPNLIYLATAVSGTPPPPAFKPHVIFVTTDEGDTIYPKAGANAHLPDGGGDSIPFSCGGAAHDGILVVP